MFNLDKKTEKNKIIPKQFFLHPKDKEKIKVTSVQKDAIKKDINRIRLNNVINKNTYTITQLENNHEICIFTLELNEKKVPKEVINVINNNVKQLNIFVLKYNDSFCYYINDFVSNWDEEVQFNFTGLNTLVIYENCIKAITKEVASLSLEQLVKKKELEEQIIKLEIKKNHEKQMNRKKELRDQIIKLKKEIW